MKKVLSFIILMVCAVTGAWAAPSVNLSDGTLTITTTEAGTLSSDLFTADHKAATSVVLVGKFNASDLQAIQTSGNDFKFTSVDMSQAEFPEQLGRTSYRLYNSNLPSDDGWAQNTLFVKGATVYKSNRGANIIIEEVESSATDQWKQQGDWVDSNKENIIGQNEGFYKFAVEAGSSEYKYYHAYFEYSWSEEPVTYNDGDNARFYVADESEQKPSPNEANQLLAVGGELFKGFHDNNNGNAFSWIPLESIDSNDWTQMKFSYWNGLEEIVLPANITADKLDQNSFYGDNNKRTLTKITSGETYAVVTYDGNNPKAQVFAGSDAEFDRMKAIVIWNNFVNQNNVSRESLSGDYIRYDANTKIAEVRVTEAGSFTQLFKGENNYEAGTVFRFIGECDNISASDLKLLATSEGKFYVDLYDVNMNTGIEDAIAKLKGENESDEEFNARQDGVIDLMRVDNTQFRGLLLPQAPEKVGTTLIQDRNEDKGETEGQDGRKATCAEFVAYNNGSVTTMHIYKFGANGDSYKQRLETLKRLMDAHVNEQDEKVIEKATTTYVVSTNSSDEIENVSLIKGNATAATIIHTYNNEMVTTATSPSMIVYPSTAGAFADANSRTNIRNTPSLEKLKFKGSISATDIAALNDFKKMELGENGEYQVVTDEDGKIVYNGPRILDLSDIPASQISQQLLAQLTNTAIEYIILPAGISKPVVGDYAALTNLRAIISSNKQSDTEHNLTAYVKVAGSLSEARSLATGTQNLNLTNVTLAGNLNAQDILTGDGGALKGEGEKVTSLDLTGAYFADPADMVLGSEGAGFVKLTDLKLPTDDGMTIIPEKCLYGIGTLTNLHIPYNFTTILGQAFNETNIDHITTEDANRALIDNGEKTYTLSANMALLGDPDAGEGGEVFPSGQAITDVYCLASRVPTCYAHTFPADLVYGNGGMGDGPYCRDKYFKDGKVIALLHFPSEESFGKATGNTTGEKETNYTTLKEKYTDPTRAYTKKDQTGAVDANGNALVWPDQKELLTARVQAERGYIWDDCTYSYASDGHLEDPTYPTGEVENLYYPNYAGWHEFVLSGATYVNPDEHVVDDVIYSYYVETGWYTICIPFDLKYSDVVKMLGVPVSTAKERSFIVKNGAVTEEVTEEAKMPDIRQLNGVIRKKGEGSQNNTIYFRLTTNLVDGKTANYLDFSEEGDDYKKTTVSAKKEGDTDDDPTCMVGGRPYIIKAYKRAYKQGEQFVEETIPAQNIGMYILTHFADDFKESASCLNNDGYYEQLMKYTYEFDGSNYSIKKKEDDVTTMKFAKPYENHKVQAVNGAEDAAGALTFSEDGGITSKRYYYTLVGQFWEQDLPQYCIYMSKGTWYRYTDTKLKFKWAPYKCVIMATPEVDADAIAGFSSDQLPVAESIMDELWTPTSSEETKPKLPQIPKEDVKPGGNFRDIKNCFFPMNMPGTADLISAPLKLTFFGRDDYDFDTPGHHVVGNPIKPAPTRYVFILDGDEEVVEYDENGNAVTAIATLDGVPQGVADSTKVYNLSGQYVGNSTEGLAKGVYIVGGRKIVVD